MSELDAILLRWLAVCIEWHEIGGGPPDLVAFISGWYLGRSGEFMPPYENRGKMKDSFAKGWAEGDCAQIIAERSES